MRHTRHTQKIPRSGEYEELEEWEKDRPLTQELTVYPDEDIDTGLVDEHGRKIMRSPRAAIGFIHFDD